MPPAGEDPKEDTSGCDLGLSGFGTEPYSITLLVLEDVEDELWQGCECSTIGRSAEDFDGSAPELPAAGVAAPANLPLEAIPLVHLSAVL